LGEGKKGGKNKRVQRPDGEKGGPRDRGDRKDN
jgi:hypothetical protein